MSTPPTGEDPRRGSPSDEPTAPRQPGYWQPYEPGPYGPQPAYGQPSYGPYGEPPARWLPGPPPPPPDRTRKRLIRALELVALAIAVGGATLVYVLSSTRLSPEAVERDVAALFEERERVAIDLTCNQRMIVRPGADYTCDGVTADGEDVEIRISITDDEGRYTWVEED